MDRMDMDSLGFMVYYNASRDSLMARERLDGKLYYVQDTFSRPFWNYMDSTRIIHDQLCFMATTTFRGRNYTAWYSSALEVPFGPWKLVGLPGLILEVFTETGELGFSADSINLAQQVTIEMPPVKNMIDLYDSWAPYLSERMKTINKVQKDRDERLLPDGTYFVEFIVPKYHSSLEILGDWEGELYDINANTPY